MKMLTKPTGEALRDKSKYRVQGGAGEYVDAGPLKGDVPPCPDSIPVASLGRKYWKLYWTAAGNWLAQADIPAVVRLCELHNVAKTLWDTIQRDGTVRENAKEGGPHVAHPMLREWDNVLGRIERIEDRLGLNPTERSRIRLQVKESESALDRWQRGRPTGTG